MTYRQGLLALKSKIEELAAMGRPAKLAWRKAASEWSKHPLNYDNDGYPKDGTLEEKGAYWKKSGAAASAIFDPIRERYHDVRGDEARAHLLAYGLVRGRRYKQLEAKHDKAGPPPSFRVAEIVTEYMGAVGPDFVVSGFNVIDWVKGTWKMERPSRKEAA